MKLKMAIRLPRMGLGGDQSFGQSDIILLDTENIFTDLVSDSW